MNSDTQRRLVYRGWPYAASPWVHLGLLLAGLAWWTAAVIKHGTWETSADANIGAGFALMWIATMGLPWSALVFSDRKLLWATRGRRSPHSHGVCAAQCSHPRGNLARRHRRRTSDEATSLQA